jgi:cytochrome c biogenesis protein CcmG, thiol:disulfide interchange protein DsbE
MNPRAVVAAGLASGVVVAIGALLVAVVLLPDPPVSADGSGTPSPAVTGPSSAPSASPSGGSAPSGATVGASIGGARFHVGEPAPPLRVPQVGGGQIDLASLHGRPVWINFMQTTCPPCVDEFPLMSGFAARYADAGLIVIAIDIREEEGTVAVFAAGLNATFPIGLDEDGSAAAAWDAVALPVHFWVDHDGIVRAGALGGIGPDVMAENLATILPGVSVTP